MTLYFLIFIGIIIIISIIYWQKCEHFINLDLKAVIKPNITVTSCKSLLPDFIPIQSQTVAKSYIDTGRIKSYKPEIPLVNHNPSSEFCYINYDIQNREKDIVMSEHNCSIDDPLFKAPFISDVFTANTPQTSLTFQPNVCVFKIDKDKINATNINTFWKSNIGFDECHKANSYILDLLDHLTNEYRDKSNLLYGQIIPSNNTLLSKIKYLGGVIFSLNNNITEKTNIYKTLYSSNEDLKVTLKQTNIYLGQIQNSYKDMVKKCESNIVNYNIIENSCNLALSNASELCIYEYMNSVVNLNSNIYLNRTFKQIITLYKEISKDYTASNIIYNKNLDDLASLKKNLSICNQNLSNLNITFGNCNVIYNILLAKNHELESDVANLIQINFTCSSNLSDCKKKTKYLLSNITLYTKVLETCVRNTWLCRSNCSSITYKIQGMERYYLWAQSYYDRLSCDSTSSNLQMLKNKNNIIEEECIYASKLFKTEVEFSELNHVTEEEMVVCNEEVLSIRKDYMDKMFPDIKKIPSHFVTCEALDSCPLTSAPSIEKGQEICDNYITSGNSKYTGQWANINGQRGGVYCSYYGNSLDLSNAKTANAWAKSNIGNLLPDRIDDYLGECELVGPYTMKCDNVPYNFKMCEAVASKDDQGIYCGNEVIDMGICAYDETCQFQTVDDCPEGKDCSSVKAYMPTLKEKKDLCDKYFSDKTNVIPTGATFTLEGGKRQGVFCSFDPTPSVGIAKRYRATPWTIKENRAYYATNAINKTYYPTEWKSLPNAKPLEVFVKIYTGSGGVDINLSIDIKKPGDYSFKDLGIDKNPTIRVNVRDAEVHLYMGEKFDGYLGKTYDTLIPYGRFNPPDFFPINYYTGSGSILSIKVRSLPINYSKEKYKNTLPGVPEPEHIKLKYNPAIYKKYKYTMTEEFPVPKTLCRLFNGLQYNSNSSIEIIEHGDYSFHTLWQGSKKNNWTNSIAVNDAEVHLFSGYNFEKYLGKTYKNIDTEGIVPNLLSYTENSINMSRAIQSIKVRPLPRDYSKGIYLPKVTNEMPYHLIDNYDPDDYKNYKYKEDLPVCNVRIFDGNNYEGKSSFEITKPGDYTYYSLWNEKKGNWTKSISIVNAEVHLYSGYKFEKYIGKTYNSINNSSKVPNLTSFMLSGISANQTVEIQSIKVRPLPKDYSQDKYFSRIYTSEPKHLKIEYDRADYKDYKYVEDLPICRVRLFAGDKYDGNSSYEITQPGDYPYLTLWNAKNINTYSISIADAEVHLFHGYNFERYLGKAYSNINSGSKMHKILSLSDGTYAIQSLKVRPLPIDYSKEKYLPKMLAIEPELLKKSYDPINYKDYKYEEELPECNVTLYTGDNYDGKSSYEITKFGNYLYFNLWNTKDNYTRSVSIVNAEVHFFSGIDNFNEYIGKAYNNFNSDSKMKQFLSGDGTIRAIQCIQVRPLPGDYSPDKYSMKIGKVWPWPRLSNPWKNEKGELIKISYNDDITPCYVSVVSFPNIIKKDIGEPGDYPFLSISESTNAGINDISIIDAEVHLYSGYNFERYLGKIYNNINYNSKVPNVLSFMDGIHYIQSIKIRPLPRDYTEDKYTTRMSSIEPIHLKKKYEPKNYKEYDYKEDLPVCQVALFNGDDYDGNSSYKITQPGDYAFTSLWNSKDNIALSISIEKAEVHLYSGYRFERYLGKVYNNINSSTKLPNMLSFTENTKNVIKIESIKVRPLPIDYSVDKYFPKMSIVEPNHLKIQYDPKKYKEYKYKEDIALCRVILYVGGEFEGDSSYEIKEPGDYAITRLWSSKDNWASSILIDNAEVHLYSGYKFDKYLGKAYTNINIGSQLPNLSTYIDSTINSTDYIQSIKVRPLPRDYSKDRYYPLVTNIEPSHLLIEYESKDYKDYRYRESLIRNPTCSVQVHGDNWSSLEITQPGDYTYSSLEIRGDAIGVTVTNAEVHLFSGENFENYLGKLYSSTTGDKPNIRMYESEEGGRISSVKVRPLPMNYSESEYSYTYTSVNNRYSSSNVTKDPLPEILTKRYDPKDYTNYRYKQVKI